MAFDFGHMNKEQKEAVQHINGPCRVIAGAGSGKTTVLTKRIEYLLSQGISPRNILAITFTKKAATEMQERLIKLVGHLGKEVTMGTFHSFGLTVIRNRYRAGNKEMPKLLNPVEQLQIINRITSPVTTVLHDKIESHIDSEVALSFISWQKNYLIMPTDELDTSCLDSAIEVTDDLVKDLQIIYKNYESLKKQENMIDFDDMLVYPYWFFKRNAEFRRKYQNIYKYILVDEFQDTNVVQYQLIKQLAGYFQNIFIVGDARQAIYSWRASKVDFILNFEQDWKNSKTIALNDNYRSTIEVVDMSTDLIKNSTINYPGICRSGRGNHGDPIFSFCVDTDTDEADMIAYLIDDYVNNQHLIEYSDVAILYRLNVQSRPFEDAFMNLDIPYYVYGSPGFYGRKEIQELLAYLRLIQEPNDLDSFEKIINIPNRRVSKETIIALKNKSLEFNTSIVNTTLNFYDINKNSSKKMLLNFAMTMGRLKAMNESEDKNVSDMLTEICDKEGYINFVVERAKGKGNADDEDKSEMIKSFIESCERFSTVKELFDYIQKVEDNKNNTAKDKVQLMSLHRSKGLEFNTVFLVGMVDGILPHSKSILLDNNGNIVPASIEEERRLCYVGITRAKERLFLCSYKTNGKKELIPSLFWKEVHNKTTDISSIIDKIKTIKQIKQGNEKKDKS